MKLTPSELRAKEDAIFHALERSQDDRTFLGRLYCDGVPTPETYVDQPVRVLFVFKEPNLSGHARPLDMRDEVNDEYFRPLEPDGTRKKKRPNGWWNRRVGLFAHAVAAALAGQQCIKAFARFEASEWNHEVVNRFAYIQIKKVGGGGKSNANDIREFAKKYATVLKQQVDLYCPHLVLGCGLGSDSPARLLAKHVFVGGRKDVTKRTNATWREFSPTARPMAMVELWHPSIRGIGRPERYQYVWDSVHEVIQYIGLGSK